METYISRIISVFSCKWFGKGGGVAVAEGVGGVVSILFLCLWIIVSFELSGHLVQWVRLWGALLTRYHCQLPFFPACPYPFLRASNFILPSTKCHTLVTLVSLRQKPCSFLKGKRVEKEGKKNFKEEEGERGKGGRDILINPPLRFGLSHLKAWCNVSGKTSN